MNSSLKVEVSLVFSRPPDLTIRCLRARVEGLSVYVCPARFATRALCCANIAPPAACQLVESSTDPDGGWHTKACHPVQRVASNLCFDPLTGQNPSV